MITAKPVEGSGHAGAEDRAQTATIEAVGAQGDGLAPGPVFVAYALPGEVVRIRRERDRGELIEILAPSPDRVRPPCPHFGACGGCALQHWAPEPYLAWKVEQIRDQLARQGVTTTLLEPFAAPPGSRRRIALHARKEGRGKVRIGYKPRRSWSLVEIDACLIADPRLVAAIPRLADLAEPLFAHPKSAPTLHLTWTLAGLDVDITGVERKSGGVSADARLRVAQAAEAGGFARVTLSGEVAYFARQPTVAFGPAVVALPPGAFLQAVPEAEAAMADFALEALAGAGRVADLFCGVGTFALRLARIASVYAADADAAMIAAMLAAGGAASGLKGVAAEARDLYRRPLLAQDLKRFDAVIFDPPRAGAAAQAEQIAASTVARVVGISCNPATFARDARTLIDGGFRLERVLPVDQFLWSPHVELAGLFVR